MNWKKILCFHSPTELIISWPEVYMNGQGDVSRTTVGAYKCGKCEGVYEWYRSHGNPTVRASLIGESQGRYAPDSVKGKIQKIRRLETSVSA